MLHVFERVTAKKSGLRNQKLEGPWQSGLWMGRASDTNQPLVATEAGVIRVRSIRRHPNSEQWPRDEALAMAWLPWSTSQAHAPEDVPWTPTEGSQACEEESQPSRRVGRPRKRTAACRQRMAEAKRTVVNPPLLSGSGLSAAAGRRRGSPTRRGGALRRHRHIRSEKLQFGIEQSPSPC